MHQRFINPNAREDELLVRVSVSKTGGNLICTFDSESKKQGVGKKIGT